MQTGAKINITENRAVLHTALRAPETSTIMVDGVNVVPEVHKVLKRIEEFSERVRGGSFLVKNKIFKTGLYGKKIDNSYLYRNRW